MQLNIGKQIINYEQKEEVFDLKREIFTHHLYYFETERENPIIIDAGAHIGLATLYFKNLYPSAKIIAFEPNPKLFELLKSNIEANNLDQVEIHQIALSKHQGKAKFFYDGTDWQWHSVGSFLPGTWDKTQKNQSEISVDTDRLGNFTSTLPYIDLLKLDIEGAEMSILLGLGQELSKIDNIIMEFHPHPGQNLTQLMAFLKKRGFTAELRDRKGHRQKSWKPSELLMIHAWKN
ncbi:MAG: FkbM family methyltransferase [Pseudomonadales bacterium]|jgi:FkbM family methyltransferase|nr:FkbM family methyltransferase [Pseudomonadales bacterium]